MTKTTMNSIFNSLKKNNWEVVARTYGNNHSTLIGLLVNWWISLSPKHTAIESGPTNGYKNAGERGQCDALFCSNEVSLGLLEVEGTRIPSTLNKIQYFFNPGNNRSDLKSLEFAIFFIYNYEPKGKGKERKFTRVITEDIRNQIQEITQNNSNKYIILIGLDKIYMRKVHGVRKYNDYYKGTPSCITGELFQNGRQISKWGPIVLNNSQFIDLD